MSAYDELVGRLEAQTIVSKGGDLYRENRNPDGPEAAAAIRTLEGERDDCDAETKRANQTAARLMIEKAEAEADRQSAEAKLEAVTLCRAALTTLVAAHDRFLTKNNGCMGDHSDAYNLVAARWSDWQEARQTLASLDQMEKDGG